MPAVTQTALAYPQMYPPMGWLKQALLLNDHVSTIVHPDILTALEQGTDLPFDCPGDMEPVLRDLATKGTWTPEVVGYLDEHDSYLEEVEDALTRALNAPSAFLAKALGDLSRTGGVLFHEGPATGRWSYNPRISWWSLPPEPDWSQRISWADTGHGMGYVPGSQE